MAKSYDYDLIVIGAGIAGFVSAVTANGLGKRVAVIEKRKVGGNCTNFTCIPSKALIRLSHLNREMAHLDGLGLTKVPANGIDSRKVMSHVRSIVKKAYEKDLPETFERIGINVIEGSAAFVDRHQVQVNGHALSAEKFIIAAGTRPVVPPIEGLRDLEYLTNENVFDLDDLPKSLIILGCGVDGLEYASAFGRLGVETTVIEMATRLLPALDRELVNHLLRTLQADGIRILSGTKALNLADDLGAVILRYEQKEGVYGEIRADRVLVTIGRRPDLEDLSLENAGVNYTSRGISIDSRLRTSSPNIYACGDIAGPYQLASTAEYQGVIAATNALMPVGRKVDYRNNVYVVFTDPPLAYIGLTEEQAHKKYGHKLRVYRFDYANMRRALIDGTQVGMAKFLCDGRGRVVGVHILGEAAPEVIHEVQVVKALKKPLYRLQAITHAYPTYAQALVGRASQLAFLDLMGNSLFVKIGLGLLPGFENRLNLARERLAETEEETSSARTANLNMVITSREILTGEIAVNASYVGNRACIIHLPPDLMEHEESPLFCVCTESGLDQKGHVILDFSGVRRMNGLGAGMLLKFVVGTKAQGRLVSAFGITRGLRDILDVTELDQVIRIYDSEVAARAAAGVAGDRITGESGHGSGDDLDIKHWAKPVAFLLVPPMPKEARNLNVDGRRAVGPVNGFGKLWQKIFKLKIKDTSIAPEQAFEALKSNFVDFQPSFNRFFPSSRGIQPGEIVLIDSSTPGGPVSTGVMVLYADEQSFTFVTPQGHPECGWVSFSAYGHEGETIVQIHGLARAGDPIYEGAFRLVGSRIQTRIWTHVLSSLAAYLGVPADISVEPRCVDPGMQWSQIGNLRYNAQVITLLREPSRLFRLAQERLRGHKN